MLYLACLPACLPVRANLPRLTPEGSPDAKVERRDGSLRPGASARYNKELGNRVSPGSEVPPCINSKRYTNECDEFEKYSLAFAHSSKLAQGLLC